MKGQGSPSWGKQQLQRGEGVLSWESHSHPPVASLSVKSGDPQGTPGRYIPQSQCFFPICETSCLLTLSCSLGSEVQETAVSQRLAKNRPAVIILAQHMG